MSKTGERLSSILNELESGPSADISEGKNTPLTTSEVVRILLSDSYNNEVTVSSMEDKIIPVNSQFWYDMDELRRWKEKNNTCYHIDYYRPIDTHTRKFGKLLAFSKRVVRKICRSLIEPICLDSSEFNGSIAASINALYNNETVTEAFTNYQMVLNRDTEKRLSELESLLAKQPQTYSGDMHIFIKDINKHISNLYEQTNSVTTAFADLQDDVTNVVSQFSNIKIEFSQSKEDNTELNTQLLHAQEYISKLGEQMILLQSQSSELSEQTQSAYLQIEGCSKDYLNLREDTENQIATLYNQYNALLHKQEEELHLKEHVKKLQHDLEKNSDEFDRALTNTEIHFLRKIKCDSTDYMDSESQIKRAPMPGLKDVLAPSNTYAELDYFEFENHFRGSRKGIKERQNQYVKYFMGKGRILDLGCGRGEFLELLKEQGIPALGVDGYKEFVEYCSLKGLDASEGLVPEYLQGLEDESYGGVFAGQLVEHLSFQDLISLCNQAYRIMIPGSCFIVETPNPTCLSTYMNSFYLDPSHEKPVHPKTLEYMLQQQGFSNIQILYTEQSKVDYRLPLLDSSAVNNLEEFNDGINFLSEIIFGSQDYAIIAYK